MAVALMDVYRRLFEAYGPRHWWPGETPFEVTVGAILVQNTNWANVAKTIDRLREDGLLSPRKLYALPEEELQERIRSCGYFRLKAKRLRNLLRVCVEEFDGSLEAMFDQSIESLRETLLGINGIGPETADSIILYAAEKPTFVVDTYTLRVLARHGWIEPEADYHTLKAFFEERLEPDVALYNEFHALFVEVGKNHCGKRPRCEGCPLGEMLPEGGPYEALR
ncbi:endonuclease III domain-containing protein [Thermostilla marina]